MPGVAARTISFDFDGVIHSAEKGWGDGQIYGDLDFEGINRCQNDGYAIVVASAGGVDRAARVLESAGYVVRRDPKMETTQWAGGYDGRVILVQPKCAAAAYIDDRAINHQFGAGWDRVCQKLRAMNEHGRDAIAETRVYRAKEKEGKCPCGCSGA